MVMTMLRIVDAKLSGETINEITLSFEQTTVTLMDIISCRVEMEVRKYNEKLTDYFNGLVCPTEAEETLNGYKMRKKSKIDVEKQVYIALHAFQSNGYLVFVDNHQMEKLDDVIQITPQTKVSFVKLMPLVGG